MSSSHATSPTADVSVRPAVVTDAARIAEVQRTAWAGSLGEEVAAAVDPERASEAWAGAIAAADARTRVLVAMAGPHLVGFAAVTPARRADDPTVVAETDGGWTAEITALEVDPATRREGHGSRLLAAVVDLSREAGAHHVAAWTLQGDEPRLAFLRGAGLEEAGLRRTLPLPTGEATEVLLTALLGEA
ncbi:GNAT family N-acetyltransferase [Serinibacter salmoneus]|uniref:Ribosomal protein S18 acetylase RimI-like enzyme n=1 Tax=Serinibacter salmoneus TaxID=556530 RepID=A0A2A9CY76_9MICO|nr:GNAT family N-acetyltransferase [Serinibacter salmoneus]PFG19343.1 ribosomal protein S18 acetylase RimI-like enzyme [Serinibacter salmoneus]